MDLSLAVELTTPAETRQRGVALRLALRGLLWPVIVPVALAAVFIVPFRFGGYLDLPNHMARASLMLTCWRDPAAAVCASYRMLPVPLPNVGADVVLMGMLAVFPPLVAEQAAMGLLLVLYIVGWYALFRQVHGGTGLAYVVGLGLLLNRYLYMGFFAYNLSLALGLLWLAYWWPRRDARTWRTSAALVAGLALVYTAHMAGFLMIFLIYMGYDFHVHVIKGRTLFGWGRTWSAAGPVVVAFAGLYWLQQAFSRTGALEVFYNPHVRQKISLAGIALDKVQIMGLSLVGYSRPVDLAVLGVSVVGLVVACLQTRREARNGFWLFAGAALLVGYLATPRSAFDVYWFDVRFLIMAYFALLVGIGRLTVNRWVAATVVVAMVMGFAHTLVARARTQPRLAAAYAAMERVPAGRRLIGLNSATTVPDSNSLVTPFEHVAKYYTLTGHGLTGGVFDCNRNANLAYFCTTDSTLGSAQDFPPHERDGVGAVSPKVAAFFRANYDYVLITHNEPHLSTLGALGDSGFQVVDASSGVTLLRNPGRLTGAVTLR